MSIVGIGDGLDEESGVLQELWKGNNKRSICAFKLLSLLWGV